MDHIQRETGLRRPPRVFGETGLLIAGDILAFLLFSIVGRRSHEMAVGPGAFLDVVATAAPFMIAWFLVGPFVGVFRSELGLREMIGRTALAWLLALPVGLVIRALVLQRWSPLVFALVVGSVNMGILVAWRGLFAWLRRRAVGEERA